MTQFYTGDLVTRMGDQEIGVISERVGMCEIDDDQIL